MRFCYHMMAHDMIHSHTVGSILCMLSCNDMNLVSCALCLLDSFRLAVGP